jgi:hypothetical protein
MVTTFLNVGCWDMGIATVKEAWAASTPSS